MLAKLDRTDVILAEGVWEGCVKFGGDMVLSMTEEERVLSAMFDTGGREDASWGKEDCEGKLKPRPDFLHLRTDCM